MIQPFRTDHAHAVSQLLAQLGYPTTADATRARFSKLLSEPGLSAFVATDEDDELVTGFIGLRVERSFEYDGVQGRILALVVDESQRGKGIGRELVEHAEEWFREHDVAKIHVTTSVRRLATHEFYKSCGFEHTGFRFVKPLS